MGVLPAIDSLSESSGDAVPAPKSKANSPVAEGKAKAKAKVKGSKPKKAREVEEADGAAEGSEKKDEEHLSQCPMCLHYLFEQL